MFKVNAINFNNALDCAAVGGGKGFVLIVSPTKRKIGEENEVQIASISSSDGEKTGRANLIIHTSDMEKDEIYYASASLKAAVVSLAKVTDIICVESKGTYLELYGEERKAEVRVELLEKDIVLQLPNSPEGVMMIMIEREKFINAIRLGGYSAEDSHIAGVDCIGFKVLEAENKLIIMSRCGTTICRAMAPIKAVKNAAEKGDAWHMVNFHFIQGMVAKLTGDMLQIAFAPKFIIVQSATAMFGAKKSESTISDGLMKIFDDKSYDYAGTIDKKDLLIGMEIAMVGMKDKNDKLVALETTENGTLKVSSESGSNKSIVIQKNHDGCLEKKIFYIEILKKGLNGCGEELHYFGKVNPKVMIIDGVDDEVEYISVIAPVSKAK